MNNRFFLVSTILIATVFAKWEGISSTSPVPAKMDLLNSNISTSTIQFTLDGFNLIAASTDKGDAFIAKIEGGASISVVVVGKKEDLDVGVLDFRRVTSFFHSSSLLSSHSITRCSS